MFDSLMEYNPDDKSMGLLGSPHYAVLLYFECGDSIIFFELKV
jgi:hypothetical protein